MRHVGEEAHVHVAGITDGHLFAQRIADAVSSLDGIVDDQVGQRENQQRQERIEYPGEPPRLPPVGRHGDGQRYAGHDVAVLVERTGLEGVVTGLEMLVDDVGCQSPLPAFVVAFEPVHDGRLREIAEIQGRKAQLQVLHVVGHGELPGHALCIGPIGVAMCLGARAEDVRTHHDGRKEQSMAHLRGDLRRHEDGETLLAAEVEGPLLVADGTTLEELVALHAVGLVEGKELAAHRVETRQAVERSKPDVARLRVGQYAAHVGTHVRGAEVLDQPRGEVQSEDAHADGGNPKVALLVLCHVAAAEEAGLVEGQLVVSFLHGLRVDHRDAVGQRTEGDAMVGQLLHHVRTVEDDVEFAHAAIVRIDQIAAVRTCCPQHAVVALDDRVDVRRQGDTTDDAQLALVVDVALDGVLVRNEERVPVVQACEVRHKENAQGRSVDFTDVAAVGWADIDLRTVHQGIESRRRAAGCR